MPWQTRKGDLYYRLPRSWFWLMLSTRNIHTHQGEQRRQFYSLWQRFLMMKKQMKHHGCKGRDFFMKNVPLPTSPKGRRKKFPQNFLRTSSYAYERKREAECSWFEEFCLSLQEEGRLGWLSLQEPSGGNTYSLLPPAMRATDRIPCRILNWRIRNRHWNNRNATGFLSQRHLNIPIRDNK